MMISIFRDVEGAGGVVLDRGKILVVREIDSDPRYGKVRGMFSVPMGSREPKEVWKEAAVREVLEETGFRVRPIISNSCPFLIPRAFIQIFWVALVDDGAVPTQTRERLNPQWMDLDLFILHKFVRFPSKEATLRIMGLIEDIADGLEGWKRREFRERFLGSYSGD